MVGEYGPSALSKQLAAFLHKHHRNDGQQRERNKTCCNDYLKYLERNQLSKGSNQQPPVLKYFKLWLEVYNFIKFEVNTCTLTLSQTTSFRLFQTERL